MALRAYLYIGNVVEGVGHKTLEDLTGVCQHNSVVSLLQKLLVSNDPRVLPSPLFHRRFCILAERAGSFSRVLALLDRIAEGEVAERDAFLATASQIREFLRALPHSSHVLLESAEVFADLDVPNMTRSLIDEIAETSDRVSRAIRGDDVALLDSLRRDWRSDIDSLWSEHLFESFERYVILGEEVLPPGTWIAPGGGEKCALCYGSIEDVAVFDPVRKGRRHVEIAHPGCVLWESPDALRSALTDVREGAVVEPWVTQSLAVDLAPYSEEQPLFAQLLDDPGDLATLTVFCDFLASAGDPYSEVIATDLAVAAQPNNAELSARQELLHQRYERYGSWGVGFLRRMRVSWPASVRRTPYNALLTKLEVQTKTWHEDNYALIAAWAPRSVRHLVVAGDRLGLALLVAALPRLTTLSLDGAAIEPLAHPHVRRLELGLRESSPGDLVLPRIAEVLRTLAPSDLPSVVELALRPLRRTDTAAICTALVETGWIAQVERLELRAIDASALAILVPALHKRLVIALEDSPIGSGLLHELRTKIEVVATDVVKPTFAVGAGIQHTGKPEWGTGRVTSVRDGKLEILFGSTKRTFKIDATFLRVVP